MAYIGETKVQLFKDGIETDITVDHNLVTNAVANVLNGGLGKGLSVISTTGDTSYNIWRMYKSIKSIAETLFGGVLLFGSTITESADHIIPTSAEIATFIGNANQGASITGSNYRGSFNATESELTSDHAKFVWDFTTAEANGTISSICLTSDLGGENGFKFNKDSTVNKDIVTLYDAMFARVNTNNASSNIWVPLVKCSQGRIWVYNGHLYSADGTTLKKYDIAKVLSNTFALADDFNQYVADTDCVTSTITSYSASTDMSQVEKDKCYTYSRSGNNLTVYTYSGDGVVTSAVYDISNLMSQLISQSWGTYGHSVCIFGGYMYYTECSPTANIFRVFRAALSTPTTWTLINMSDDIKAMCFGTSTSSRLSTAFSSINGVLYLKYRSQTDTDDICHVKIDTATFTADTEPSFSLPAPYNGNIFFTDPCVASPFMLALNSDYSSSNWGLNLVLYTKYLATINNLVTPVIKTSDKSMKVTYTLTQS